MMTMKTNHFSLCLILLTTVVTPAFADVYAWVDGNGKLTYSDATPPKGARILSVVHDAPVTADSVAARKAAQDEQVRVLSQRIAVLEQELDRSARAPAPIVAYSAPPAPPACDPNWWGCSASAWSPPVPFYVAPLFTGRERGERRFEHRHAQQSGGQFGFGGRSQLRNR